MHDQQNMWENEEKKLTDLNFCQLIRVHCDIMYKK